MELVLTAIAAPPQSDVTGQSQVFDAAGGTLGRAADNTWVLADPDRVVSSHHATINCLNGQFLLIDHSTNGTFVNGAELPLGQGNSVLLKEGDYFSVGGFQFLAALRQPVAQPAAKLGGSFLDQLAPPGACGAAASTPAGPAAHTATPPADGLDELDKWLEPAAPAAPTSPWSGQAASAGGPLPFEQQATDTDPLALLNARTPASDPGWLDAAPSAATAADDDWWRNSQPDNAPVDQQAMHIPPPVCTGDAVDIDALLGLPPESPSAPPFAPEPVSAPQPAAASPSASLSTPPSAPPAPAGGTAFETTAAPIPAAPPPAGPSNRRLAAQLGLQQITDDQIDYLTDTVAAVVRETAERLIDILRARSSIKNELRLERTMISANENNPLKFSPRAEEALSYMFEHRGGAFLQGEKAIRDSFDDLADHQVAVLAGMRAAYETMLAEFDPVRLEQRLNAGASLLGNRNARRWEAYQEYYARLASDPEGSYSRLFGETFARAYEAQINELKTARNFNHDR